MFAQRLIAGNQQLPHGSKLEILDLGGCFRALMKQERQVAYRCLTRPKGAARRSTCQLQEAKLLTLQLSPGWCAHTMLCIAHGRPIVAGCQLSTCAVLSAVLCAYMAGASAWPTTAVLPHLWQLYDAQAFLPQPLVDLLAPVGDQGGWGHHDGLAHNRSALQNTACTSTDVQEPSLQTAPRCS